MIPGRYVSSTLFYTLVGTCLVLAVVCACLISTIVLMHHYEKGGQEDNVLKEVGDVLKVAKISKMEWEEEYRISPFTIPEHYELFLHPDIYNGTFKGTVKIDVKVSAPQTYIALHARALNITDASASRIANKTCDKIELQDTIYYEPNAFVVLRPVKGKIFDVGTVRINLAFEGLLKGKIVGFYQSSYLTPNGKPRYLATTKFEPVDARSAFPCFDEPGLKAKFTISIVRPTNEYSALSNMHIKSQESGPELGLTTVHYHTTVPMSTYLVCFIVSDFTSAGPAEINNNGQTLPITVYSTPQQVNNTLYARKIAVDVTKFYINYFGIPYSLPKLDLIAIPDFASGAMENWGLVTFRETALLFNKNLNSVSEEMRVARVVAHEIAHQWFGNLVTMQWWDDLWLNEGFAKFMEFKSIANGVPESASWNLEDYFIYSITQGVMDDDAAVNSHPIVQAVSNPDEINQLFDKISYLKGASVLRMLENFLGEAKFRKGLQNYLKAYQFENAATKDLWQSLNELAEPGINVGEIMDTWTKQMGYPVITVKRTSDEVTISQTRFLSSENATFEESCYGYKWDIPVTYITSSNNTPTLVWLNRTDVETIIPVTSSETFIKFNHRQVGFYRVNYDIEEWKVLTNNFEKFSPADQAQLLNDVFALAAANYIPYPTALDMVSSVNRTNEFLPWATAVSSLVDLSSNLYYTTFYPAFMTFLRQLVEPMYGPRPDQFNWNVKMNDSFTRRQLRITIISLACRAGVEKCIKDVAQIFEKWLQDPSSQQIHPDLQSLAYVYGMQATGDFKTWSKLWDLYKNETIPQRKVSFQRALAATREPWILQHYLNLAWLEENVRSQDYIAVLQYISRNPVGRSIIWDFYRNNWQGLIDRFSLRNRQLGASILTFTKAFATPLKLEELDSFYAKYPMAGAGEAARKNARENIITNIEWIGKHCNAIGTWLSNNS